VASSLPSLVVSLSHNSLVAVSIALVLVQAAALWWRRRNPVVVLTVIALAALPLFAISQNHEPAGSALAFGVYAVYVYGANRVRLLVAAIAIAIIGIAVASPASCTMWSRTTSARWRYRPARRG
jgi:hypothetical protein